jgi:hypothetical protein
VLRAISRKSSDPISSSFIYNKRISYSVFRDAHYDYEIWNQLNFIDLKRISLISKSCDAPLNAPFPSLSYDGRVASTDTNLQQALHTPHILRHRE